MLNCEDESPRVDHRLTSSTSSSSTTMRTPMTKVISPTNLPNEVLNMMEFLENNKKTLELLQTSEVATLLKADLLCWEGLTLYVLWNVDTNSFAWYRARMVNINSEGLSDGRGKTKNNAELYYYDEKDTRRVRLTPRGFVEQPASAKPRKNCEYFVVLRHIDCVRKRLNLLDESDSEEEDMEMALPVESDSEEEGVEMALSVESDSDEDEESLPVQIETRGTWIDPTSKWKWKFGSISIDPRSPTDIHRRKWIMRTGVESIHQNDGLRRSHLDYFLAAFPEHHWRFILAETNIKITTTFGNSQPLITHGELIRFIGVILLISMCEFGSRRELWTENSDDEWDVLPKPRLGRFMSRNRFEAIRQCLIVSKVVTSAPSSKTEANLQRWSVVDDLINAFNDHMERRFTPSSHLCLDESFSRWYGIGG